jgi:hypothetical protein
MKNIIGIKSLLLFAALLASCSEPDYPEAIPSITTGTSKLLVVHTYAGGPRVKVKMDNRISDKDTLRFEKAPDGKFYNNITLSVPAGPNRLVSVADLNNSNLVTDRYTAATNTNNTSFITYSVSGGVVTPAVVRVADDLAAPDPGFAKVRFLNFSGDVGEVKLVEVGEELENAISFSLRKFKETSRKVGSTTTDFNRFSTVTINNYPNTTSRIADFEVRNAADEVLFTINDVKFDSKSIYTIYLKGNVAGEGDLALNYAVIKH